MLRRKVSNIESSVYDKTVLVRAFVLKIVMVFYLDFYQMVMFLDGLILKESNRAFIIFIYYNGEINLTLQAF